MHLNLSWVWRLFERLCLFALLAVMPGLTIAAKEIALTFDDAPRPDSTCLSGEQRTQRLLQQLQATDGVPVMFMATTKHVRQLGDERLRAYTVAGHLIGNHSHSHRHPEDLGLADYLEDVKTADSILKPLQGYHRYYRFPFLNEGRDIAMRDGLRAGLKALAQRQAYVTVDNYDWYMDHHLQMLLKQPRFIDAQKLGRIYVREMLASVMFYDRIAREHLGRSPRHVLLLHENDLAALFLNDLIQALRDAGWTLISPLDAYQDPIAETLPNTLFNNQGRVAALAHLNGAAKRDLVPVNEEETYLDALFDVEALALADLGNRAESAAIPAASLQALCSQSGGSLSQN